MNELFDNHIRRRILQNNRLCYSRKVNITLFWFEIRCDEQTYTAAQKDWCPLGAALCGRAGAVGVPGNRRRHTCYSYSGISAVCENSTESAWM